MDILEAARLEAKNSAAANTACNWLADHPRWTAAILVVAILIAGQLEAATWL